MKLECLYASGDIPCKGDKVIFNKVALLTFPMYLNNHLKIKDDYVVIEYMKFEWPLNKAFVAEEIKDGRDGMIYVHLPEGTFGLWPCVFDLVERTL